MFSVVNEKEFIVINSQRIYIVVSTVAADALAPPGARASAGPVMRIRSPISMTIAFKGFNHKNWTRLRQSKSCLELVRFLQNYPSRHPIAHPWGWDTVSLLGWQLPNLKMEEDDDDYHDHDEFSMRSKLDFCFTFVIMYPDKPLNCNLLKLSIINHRGTRLVRWTHIIRRWVFPKIFSTDST